jgi:hypothetical protein
MSAGGRGAKVVGWNSKAAAAAPGMHAAHHGGA